MSLAGNMTGFYLSCPGVEITREVEDAIGALPDGSSASAIQAVVLPLIPDGNPFEYVNAAPVYPGTPMPGASPVLAAALPPQPNVAEPIDGNSALGTVNTFAKGLPRFQDSNPDPYDGWSIDMIDPSGPW